MPYRRGVKLEKYHLHFARLSIALMRNASIAYLREEQFGSHADETLLCISISSGQMDGKPMSASKLARFIGMPRATVLRKLADLIGRGLVERDGHSTYVLPAAKLNNKDLMRAIAELTRMIHDISTELPILDI